MARISMLPLAAALVLSLVASSTGDDWDGEASAAEQRESSVGKFARDSKPRGYDEGGDAVLECYDGPFDDTQMEGCAEGGCVSFMKLRQAEDHCNEHFDCNGITTVASPENPAFRVFQVRRGPEIMDDQGSRMWVKQEDCQGEGGTERDDEYEEGDEEEGQIEQQWDDALNERYGLENERHDPWDFDDDGADETTTITVIVLVALFLPALVFVSYKRGHPATLALVGRLQDTLRSPTSALNHARDSGYEPTSAEGVPLAGSARRLAGGSSGRGDYSAL